MTWYISQMDAEQAEAMGKAFTAANPSIREEVVWVTGQVAFQRLKMDIENTTPHCDGFSASDISHMAILKDRGQLRCTIRPRTPVTLLTAGECLVSPTYGPFSPSRRARAKRSLFKETLTGRLVTVAFRVVMRTEISPEVHCQTWRSVHSAQRLAYPTIEQRRELRLMLVIRHQPPQHGIPFCRRMKIYFAEPFLW